MGVLLNLRKSLLPSSNTRYGKTAETSVLQPSVHGTIIPPDIHNQVQLTAIDLLFSCGGSGGGNCAM